MGMTAAGLTTLKLLARAEKNEEKPSSFIPLYDSHLLNPILISHNVFSFSNPNLRCLYRRHCP